MMQLVYKSRNAVVPVRTRVRSGLIVSRGKREHYFLIITIVAP
jgi:hypothetical protein